VSLSILLTVSATGAAVAWIAVAVVRDTARRRGLLDMPNARSSHDVPTPRLGGLGIVAAVGASIGRGAALGLDATRLVPLLAVAAAVAGLSLIDDLRGLPALARLAGHVFAAAVLVWSVGAFTEIGLLTDLPVLPSGGLLLSPSLGAVVTAAWIVFFLNAFNFMDGIDGIAAVQALVAGAAWAAIGWLLGEPALALIGATVAGACAGFLRHNWSPATIFMGDVGSAFLGVLIAGGPLTTRPPQTLLIPAVLSVWPFVFDTALTLVRRVARGENLLTAHRSHLYQRLTQAGWSHRRVATLYGALAAGGALLAIPVATGLAIGATTALAIVGIAAAALWTVVLRAERLQDRGAVADIQDSSRA
jgi:Fuc2NAc and GlcNAc transferase